MDLDRIKTLVRSSSKGLADVTRNKASEVQFIHESVRDFLLGKYEGQWFGVSGNFVGYSHEILKNCCFAQLNASLSQDVDIPDLLPQASEAAQLRETITLKFPFLKYSISSILCHANEAQLNAIEQRDFLAHFPLQQWIFLNNTLERYISRRYTKSTSIFYILAENNLADLIRIHPQRQSCFDIGDDRYGSPPFAALATKSNEAFRAILEIKAETRPQSSTLHDLCKQLCPNQDKRNNIGREFTYSRRRTFLSNAVSYGDEILVAFVLESEIYMLNDNGLHGQTLLFQACFQGHEAVVKLLLEKGAEVDINDDYSEKAFWQTTFFRREYYSG